MTGLDDFREWLLGRGFKVAKNSLQSQSNLCDWYACRRSEMPARRCECNDDKRGVQIVVHPHLFEVSSVRHESAEVSISGEAGGVWFELKAYSMKPAEFQSKSDEIERMLVAAWNALVPEKAE
jgi:hypothetical protein